MVELLSGLEKKGYHVYFNNFYTSPTLCKRLFTLGFGSCGTVGLDRRGISVTFNYATPNKGDITTYQNGNILGLKWKDKWYVHTKNQAIKTNQSTQYDVMVTLSLESTAVGVYVH